MKEKLIKLLGLDAEATEDQILEALSSKLDNSDLLKALGLKTDASDTDVLDAVKALDKGDTEVSLEDRAKAEGKVVVDAKDWTETKAGAAAGKAAAAELKQDKFDRAFEAALKDPEGPRVDAKEETRQEWQELYDLAPEQALKRLDALPRIANAKPRGSGEGGGTDAPDNVDQERFELNEKAEARMVADDCSYEEALRKVRAEEKS